MQIDQTQVFTGCLEALAPFAVLLLGLHFQNRRDWRKRDKDLETERTQFREVLKNFRLHKHNERHGALTVENIEYPANGAK